MKKYYQIEKKSGRVIGIYFLPSETERSMSWQELCTDEYDDMKIGELVRFTRQSELKRIE